MPSSLCGLRKRRLNPITALGFMRSVSRNASLGFSHAGRARRAAVHLAKREARLASFGERGLRFRMPRIRLSQRVTLISGLTGSQVHAGTSMLHCSAFRAAGVEQS
jgi:hypothetical protein